MIPEQLIFNQATLLLTESHIRTAQQIASKLDLDHRNHKILEMVLASLYSNNDLLYKFGLENCCGGGCSTGKCGTKDNSDEGTLDINDDTDTDKV